VKNIFIIVSLTVSSVVLFLGLDILFWHIFGLDWRKNQYGTMYSCLYWLGLIFAVMATPFAAWRVRSHWRSSLLLGQFIWCSMLLVGYSAVFVWCAERAVEVIHGR
jgi:hypothetical protein